MFMRVAAVSPYESPGGASRIWVTLGGQTAQAFYVSGLITSLSTDEVAAKTAETITVTGMGFNQISTPTVTITAEQAVFEYKGKATTTLELPATVQSVNTLSFKYPGTLLPSGVTAVNTKVTVNSASKTSTNATDMLLTSDSDSGSLGLDVANGRWSPRVSTVWAGSIVWSFKSTNGAKIFVMPTCVKYKTTKGVKTCIKTELADTATCSLTQPLPINKKEVRRVVVFKSPCQLNMAGKLSLLDSNVLTIASTSTFKRAYAKTNLTYVLVRGKKTKILQPTIRLCNYELGNKALIRKSATCKYK